MHKFIILIFSFLTSISIWGQNLSSITFKYKYGENSGYVDSENNQITKNISLPFYSSMIRADSSHIVIGGYMKSYKAKFYGLMTTNMDTIVPMVFDRIKYINNDYVFGVKKSNCSLGWVAYYKLYSTKDTIELIPDCVYVEKNIEDIMVLSTPEKKKLILTFNENFSKNELSVYGVKLHPQQEIREYYRNNNLKIFEIYYNYEDIPKKDTTNRVKLDSQILSAIRKVKEGSRFQYDSINKVFNVYKDWYTNDTLVSTLTDVTSVHDEFYNHEDSLYYYICSDVQNKMGIKNQKNETIFPFKNGRYIKRIFQAEDRRIYVKITSIENKLKGISSLKGEGIIKPVYRKIFYTKMFDKDVFICTNTSDKKGLLNITGEILLPFNFHEITSYNSIISCKESKWDNKTIINKNGKIFYLNRRGYDISRINEKYYALLVYNIKLEGYERNNLRFVFDNEGNYYLPKDIEKKLRERIQKENDEK